VLEVGAFECTRLPPAPAVRLVGSRACQASVCIVKVIEDSTADDLLGIEFIGGIVMRGFVSSNLVDRPTASEYISPEAPRAFSEDV